MFIYVGAEEDSVRRRVVHVLRSVPTHAKWLIYRVAIDYRADATTEPKAESPPFVIAFRGRSARSQKHLRLGVLQRCQSSEIDLFRLDRALAPRRTDLPAM